MRVLIIGARGFIGGNLAYALSEAGHEVTIPKGVDLASVASAQEWLPSLSGVDAVINAAGIIRERGARTFSAVHDSGPRSLFDACVLSGVKTVIQISALGADGDANSRFHLTKRAADDHLATLDIDWVVVQPSVVLGEGGASMGLFSALAALPVFVVPDTAARVQPVHIDDLVSGIVALLGDGTPRRLRLQAAGAESYTFEELLQVLREGMGLPRARVLRVPMWVVRIAARLGDLLGRGPMNSEALQMLERGNVSDAEVVGEAGAFESATGVAPRSMREAFKSAAVSGPEGAAAGRTGAARMHIAPGAASRLLDARLSILRPLLRLSLAFIWIFTGALSAGIYPVAESYALMDRLGVTSVMAPFILYPTAIFEILLGCALFLGHLPRVLGVIQLGLIFGFTTLITAFLPEYWVHPFGPLTKNLPVIVAILVLVALDEAKAKANGGTKTIRRRQSWNTR